MKNGKPDIIVIDDDKAILDMMEIILSDHGYHIRTFTDVNNGIEHIKNHRPNLVLLDIWMPGRSGWKIAKEIKRD